MADDYEVEVTIKKNGRPLEGFDPLVRTLSVDEDAPFDYEHANDGDTTTFTTVPDSKVADARILVVKSNKAVTLKLGEDLAINADGFLVAFGITLDVGAGSNAKINNNSGATAQIEGLVAGT